MISAKKRVSFIETTLRTLLFTKVSSKSNGLSISEKILNNIKIQRKIFIYKEMMIKYKEI